MLTPIYNARTNVLLQQQGNSSSLSAPFFELCKSVTACFRSLMEAIVGRFKGRESSSPSIAADRVQPVQVQRRRETGEQVESVGTTRSSSLRINREQPNPQLGPLRINREQPNPQLGPLRINREQPNPQKGALRENPIEESHRQITTLSETLGGAARILATRLGSGTLTREEVLQEIEEARLNPGGYLARHSHTAPQQLPEQSELQRRATQIYAQRVQIARETGRYLQNREQFTLEVQQVLNNPQAYINLYSSY